MDWALEDNMVDGLFFCATLTGRRVGHTPLVQAAAETSDTGAEVVKPDPGSSWEGYSGGLGAGVGDENAESCGQARNQRGTPGGAKSFLGGAQNFWTMSNSFKRCPTHFSRGGKNFSRGYSPPCSPSGCWPACGVVRPLRIPLVIRPLRRTDVVVVR